MGECGDVCVSRAETYEPSARTVSRSPAHGKEYTMIQEHNMIRLVRASIFSALAFAACLAMSPPSHAGGVEDATITRLAIDRVIGADILFIMVDKTKSNKPSCQPNDGGWAFVLPLSTDGEKRMYAMLLAARAAGSKVSLGGHGDPCSVFGSIETLQSVHY